MFLCVIKNGQIRKICRITRNLRDYKHFKAIENVECFCFYRLASPPAVLKNLVQFIEWQIDVCLFVNKTFLTVSNPYAVNDWFCKLKSKDRLTFRVFDIVGFYLSISEQLLVNANSFANHYISLSEQDKGIILQSRKSLLFDNEPPWAKHNNSSFF